jgi:type IV pilus assembly protein PilO
MDLHNERTARWILAGLCTVGLFSVYFGTKLVPFTYRARAAQIRELAQRYEERSAELTRARASVAQLGTLETELAFTEASWQRAQRLLPEETQVASLLREITLSGQAYGVDFTLFKPMPVTPQAEFTEHPVEIKVEGGYHQIARFLNRVATMDRIVHVRELELTQAPPAAEGESATAPASARFVAVAYVLGGTGVEGGATPAAEAAGDAKPGLIAKTREVVRGRAPSEPSAQGGSDE